nr:zinc finger, CCHC-type [Tanacetum cinerariifolium]
MGDANPIRTLGDYSKPSHEGYKNTIELPVGNNVVPLRSDTIRLVQNGCSFHGLWSKDPNQHLKDFLKLVDSLDLDGKNRERTHLRLFQFSLRDQASNCLERLPVGSITRWEDLTTHFLAQFFPSGRTTKLHNDILMFQQHHGESLSEAWTHFKDLLQKYCMEDPEQAFVMHHRVSTRQEQQRDPYNDETTESKEEEKDSSENTNTNPSPSPDPFISFSTEKVWDDGDVMFIEIVKKDDDSLKEEPKEGGLEVEYFDTFLTRSELAYHKYLMCGPIPSIFLRNPIITKGCPSNLKIPCNIRHVHVEKAYIDLNSPLNIVTRMMYNWIMRRKLKPRKNSNRGVSNFTRRIKGMHIFIGNFTYVRDFMIFEDISSIIDPRMPQVVLGRPFVEISNMTHDPPEGVVRFTNGTKEVAYKMPHKIEKYNSLSNLEKEHTKSVYLRNEEDKRRGVECV